MTKFVWLGLSTRGELKQYELLATRHAEAHPEAVQQAKVLGVQMVELRAVGTRAGNANSPSFAIRSLFGRNRLELSLFASELLALLKAGLALTEAIETLDERAKQNRQGIPATGTHHHILSGLTLLMQQGKSFSAALSSYPEHFSRLFIAMLTASEKTGDMPQALERYLQYHAQVSVVRQKLISASLYPAMLLLAGTVVAFFLICFLAPRFGQVYEGMTHIELPLLSRWLISFGVFISEHILASATIATMAIVACAAAVLHPGTQKRCLDWLTRITWVHRVMKLVQLTRFYRSVGTLLHGGVPLLASLDMTRSLLTSSLQTGLARSMKNIEQGKPLSESLHEESLLTPIALRLMRAGERNGQIAGMLEQAALFHEREISQWVERFARLVEPILMLIMGLGIGLVVVLLYQPIFDLAGSLQ
jgi:general secretion pathway protein F